MHVAEAAKAHQRESGAERADEAAFARDVPESDLVREDAEAREPPLEDRRAFAEAPCFVFLGAITSESYGQASDVRAAQSLPQSSP